jgi:hypothetical protein
MPTALDLYLCLCRFFEFAIDLDEVPIRQVGEHGVKLGPHTTGFVSSQTTTHTINLREGRTMQKASAVNQN